ncbi:MAG: ATP-grasp domain-containing protein [Pseudomonadota bacterium]
MKILLLIHPDLIPPDKVDEKSIDWEETLWTTEYQVQKGLEKAGHEVEVLGVSDELKAIRVAVKRFEPHVVFNLLEEFKGEAIFDQNVVSYLELLGAAYTGCNPKGLIIGRDKALSKKILSYHKIASPKFQVIPKNNPKKRLKEQGFPQIVKCLNEEASLGLSQASIVTSLEKLRERAEFIHEQFRTDAITEQFIEGKEYFVGVIGNYRLQALPVWDLKFEKTENPDKEFYSTKAKFDQKYREKKGISTGAAEIEEALTLELQKVAKRAYKSLGLSGYARMDLRVDKNGRVYVLEANPNPDISEIDDFAQSAKAAGISYPDLLDKILRLGKQWTPH